MCDYLRCLSPKDLFFISLFYIGLLTHAQTALYNNGNLQIHPNGKIGFHTNLINDATFDKNLGLVGFYGNDMVSISGVFKPIFYDIEIANQVGLSLYIPISTTNNVNFVLGDIITPKTQKEIYLNFLKNAFYTGATNTSKVQGFVQIKDRQTYTFPVGDSQQLRPLIINSEVVNKTSNCAYFLSNTYFPNNFEIQFPTDIKSNNIQEISTIEFWSLQSSRLSKVTISWNERSNIASLTDNVNNIEIVGWNKIKKQWLSLGNTSLNGDLNHGFVSSDSFIPNDYEIITFGTTATVKKLIKLKNYLITPNGDGTNDALIIGELQQYSNNTLSIYNRIGIKIYQKKYYTNQFKGFSNINNISFKKEKPLPMGVYFYTVLIDGEKLNFQGFVYLKR